MITLFKYGSPLVRDTSAGRSVPRILLRVLFFPFTAVLNFLHKRLGLNRNYLFVIALVIALSAWMLSGILSREPPQPPSAGERTNEVLKSVLVQRVLLEQTERFVRVSGKTREERRVDIKAELSGTVEKINAREGEKVATDTSLIQLEQEEAYARLRQAEAQEQKARLEHRTQVRLRQRRLSSTAEAAQAEANYEATRATTTLARKQYEATQVRAPFEGTIEALHVEKGDFVQPGQLLASLYDYSPMLVIGDLSELEVPFVRVGLDAAVRLATGEELTGKVRYVSAQSDERSRTFEVQVEVDNSDGKVLAGVTAEIDFQTDTVEAVKVTPALLTINDDGQIGIKVVRVNTPVVELVPVEVIKAETNEMWVTGINSNMLVITRGFGFVEPGDRVAVTEDTKT